MPKQFAGKVSLDVRDSTPDWAPFLAETAPEGAPNVLIVLYDDTGLAAWEPYGGRIEMPTLSRLAANGLTYSQWHTTALCSPTRSCLLTGRNHHQNGFAQIAEGAQGFPGHTGHIPMENAAMAEVLRQRGWNTFWVGKNHNVPVDEWAMGGSKRGWPLARGFDRFYGFIGGETNQWYPTLVEDNHAIDQPYAPEDGHHLSKDLADKAIGYVADATQSAPGKPWFLWFCPGANHAPHHAPQEFIDRYRGKFDDGYGAYREWVLPRMIERGIFPDGTELTPLNPMPDGSVIDADKVRPWEELSDDEKRLFARMAEVYAGFSEYTDHQVGRIVDYLEESGQLDNTIIVYCADNGASGEGSPSGSVNENRFFNAWPDDAESNLEMIDQLGSPSTYNHYPTGWAAAFSTPFRMFKRYTYQGGVSDPLVIHWPAGIRARGEVRHQYHHAVDIVPTILECCGVEFPSTVLGYEQTPLPGVSMKYSFDAADAPTTKQVQYYEMLGSRGLWSDGWKAVAEHGPMIGRGDFENDNWQLFHTDEDRSEAHDLAATHPDKVRELVDLWYAEAGKYDVLPLDDRTVAELVAAQPEALVPPGGTYAYYPGTLEVPEFAAANTRGRSFKILADVDITDPDAHGVIFAQGARFGGHALFLKDRRLWYVYNFIGIPPEQQLISARELEPGRQVLGMEFVKEKVGERHETHGGAKLYVGDQVVAEGPLRTQPGHFAIAGEGLSIGRDSGDSVSKEYTPQFPFTGGRIVKVEVNIADDVYIDVERAFAAAMARD
ncbi:arylsulfatase [Paractinoplanes maris]|uniref:arylsulfatase n=1 Tax=Paractinoplanes maris TaxID=1734446 RepID=UPI00201FE2DC|nr:arylsulfatase [Actinoplanes maris]